MVILIKGQQLSYVSSPTRVSSNGRYISISRKRRFGNILGAHALVYHCLFRTGAQYFLPA